MIYKKKLILTTYCYFRQAALSIDRGLDSWNEAKLWLQDRNIINDLFFLWTTTGKYSNPSFCFFHFINNDHVFIKNEYHDEIITTLENLKRILDKENPSRDELVNVRLECSEIAETLSYRIKVKILNNYANPVEHYNQHFGNKGYTIDEVIKLSGMKCK